MTESELEDLRRLGLSDPPSDLRHDLASHPELIPYRGDHSPFLFIPDEAVLLPGNWVCAYFEDGMNPGHLLLHYEVHDGGKIAWKRLDGEVDR